MIMREYLVQKQSGITAKTLGDILEDLIPVTLDLAKLKGTLTEEIDDNISSLLIPEVDDELEDEDTETEDDLLLERMLAFYVNAKDIKTADLISIFGMFDNGNAKLMLKRSLGQYDIVKTTMKPSIETYCPPTEDEKRLLIKDVIEGLSSAAYFLWIELKLFDNTGVYRVVMESLEKLNISLDEFKRIVQYYFLKYPIRFGVIDDYPDLWEKVLTIVDDAFVTDLYEFVDRLNRKDLVDIINGAVIVSPEFIDLLADRDV